MTRSLHLFGIAILLIWSHAVADISESSNEYVLSSSASSWEARFRAQDWILDREKNKESRTEYVYTFKRKNSPALAIFTIKNENSCRSSVQCRDQAWPMLRLALRYIKLEPVNPSFLEHGDLAVVNYVTVEKVGSTSVNVFNANAYFVRDEVMIKIAFQDLSAGVKDAGALKEFLDLIALQGKATKAQTPGAPPR